MPGLKIIGRARPSLVSGGGGGPTWTIDALSGQPMPANGTEHAAWRTANGLSNWAEPGSLYTFQELSGNVLDQSGARPLSPFGSGHVYAQTVAGWARKFAFLTDGTTGAFRTLDAPDIALSSCLLAAVIAMPSSAPVANRNLLVLGTSSTARITSGARLGSASGSNPATGSVDPTGKTMLVFLQVDRTNGVQRVVTPDEVITPVLGTLSGKVAYFGSSASAADAGYGWGAIWDGADGERSLQDLYDYYVARGTTPSWSP